MKILRILILAVIWLQFSPPVAQADGIRPNYLEISELSQNIWAILLKVPAKGTQRLAVHVEFPKICVESNRGSRLVNGAFLERWHLKCGSDLVNRKILVTGLEKTRSEAIVRVIRADGTGQTQRLTPSDSTFVIKSKSSWVEVSTTYLVLGFEHILSGYDHLLFVLALLFLVGSWRRLVAAITTFTLAHSVTLVAASFGWVNMPPSLIEVLIVLSIVFVAVDILQMHQGKPSIATRMPWVIAFLFGLLHGFGFAGALSEIGLPQHAIPLALLFFNVGVELGQLTFVACVIGLFFIANYLLARRERKFALWELISIAAFPAAYLIGSIAMFWVFERTYNFII